MNNRQVLTIKQVKHLQDAHVDLSQSSMIWVELDNGNTIAVNKDFAEFFFLKDTLESNTICPAPTLSDLIETVLPSSILTWNNLRYFLTIQSAPMKEGVRYKCAYMLHTTLSDYDGVPLHIYKTCQHDNALDAAYEAILTMIAEGDKHLLQTHE